jgi:hypothetical protein
VTHSREALVDIIEDLERLRDLYGAPSERSLKTRLY